MLLCSKNLKLIPTFNFREMIHSLFIVNQSGDIFLEKHWKSVISRSIVDYFFDAQNKVRFDFLVPKQKISNK